MKILQHSSGIIQHIKSFHNLSPHSTGPDLVSRRSNSGLKVHQRSVSVWQRFHYLMTDHRGAHNNTDYSTAQQKYIGCS
jgi:hypothetical protein